VESLLTLLDEGFDRRSWHGPNLRGSLRGVSPKQAAWRPRAGRHNIWELVMHAAYWKYVVRRKITGAKRGSFPLPGANWFARPVKPTAIEWKKDLALLADEHRKLRAAVAGVPASDLRGKKGWMIRGAAAHDLYHAGQIRLLRRLCPIQ
jgi:DinB superfamily